MKVKLTYPATGYQTRVGHIIDIDPEKAKTWLANDWCIEVADEEMPKPKKVKHEPKPAKEL